MATPATFRADPDDEPMATGGVLARDADDEKRRLRAAELAGRARVSMNTSNRDGRS